MSPRNGAANRRKEPSLTVHSSFTYTLIFQFPIYWNQAPSCQCIRQLGAWFQMHRELEDQGVYHSSWIGSLPRALSLLSDDVVAWFTEKYENTQPQPMVGG